MQNEECRMKNVDLKMKNEERRTFSSAKPMKNVNYSNGEGKIYSSFLIGFAELKVLHSSLPMPSSLLVSVC